MKKLIQANILNVVTALFALSLLSVFYFSGYSPIKAEQSSIIGEQKTLVALFNYADDQSKPVTLDEIKNRIMYDTQSVDNFVKENSYNKAWLNPTFFDWRPLPSTAAEYNDREQIANDAVKILDNVYFPDYDKFIFIFLNNGKPLGAATTGEMYFETQDGDDFFTSISWLEALSASTDTIAHELGHQFGFGHASTFDTGANMKIPATLIDFSNSASSSYNTYGDQNDTMGGASKYNDWSTIWKEKAGWLDPSQIQVATQSAEFEFDQAELPSNGIKMLKIPLGKDPYGNEAYYFLEYRKPLGFFDYNPNPYNNYSVDDSVQVRLRSYHYASFWGTPGWQSNTVRFPGTDANIDQPFFDPYRGIKIELLEKTGEGADSKARVKVTFSGVDLNSNNYLMKYVESDYDKNPQILTVSNNTTNAFDIGQVNIAGRDSSSYNIVEDNASNKTIAIGGTATIKLRFSPTSSSQKFAYLNVPTNSDIRPNATVSLYGRDDFDPGWWPNKPISLSVPTFSTNTSATNSFNLNWFVTDSFSTIAGYQLQYHSNTTTAWYNYKIDGGDWTTKKSAKFTGKPGYTYYFRVRAKDQAGNIGDFSDGHSTIVPYDNSSLNYSSNWKSVSNASSFKNTLKYTGVTNAYSTFTFVSGGTVALIAPKGPNRGKLDVYIRDKVNGVWTSYVKATKWQPIDLYSSTTKKMVPIRLDTLFGGWDKTWSDTLIHQVKFVVTGKKRAASTSTRVFIDGLAIEKNPYGY